jgi:glycosyltransferase involved in cell wall biosynthesis
MPKILHYCFDYPDRLGGIELYVLRLAQAMAGSDYESVIVCSHDTPFHRLLQESGLPHRSIALPPIAKSSVAMLDANRYEAIWRILRQEKPDLVHAHWGRIEQAFIKWLGYPLVYTFHSYGASFNLSMIDNPLQRQLVAWSRPLFRNLVPSLDALLFVSHAEQTRMRAEGFLPPNDISEVVHNGLPLAQLRQQAQQAAQLRAQLNVPPDARVVSFVCRLDRDKNAMAFIPVAEQLAQRVGGPLRIWVAGNGQQQGPFLQALRASSVADISTFLGYRKDVGAVFAASDITLNVTLQEGFGLRVVEAMAVGTPPVSYGVGGITEILDIPDGPRLLAPAGDVNGLVDRAANLLLQPDPALNERLRLRADQFDERQMIAALERVYARVLARPLVTVTS